VATTNIALDAASVDAAFDVVFAADYLWVAPLLTGACEHVKARLVKMGAAQAAELINIKAAEAVADAAALVPAVIAVQDAIAPGTASSAVSVRRAWFWERWFAASS